jgi:hypothetical protein
MGNLPFARTASPASGDPVESALLAELQDMFVGDKRTHFERPQFPIGWTTTGTAPTLVANPQAGGEVIPVWKLPTGATHRTRANYMEPNDSLVDMVFDIFGDGVADWTLTATFSSDLTAAPAQSLTIASGSVNNSPASWTRYTMSVVGAVVNIPLQRGYIHYEFGVAGGGAQIYLGNLWMLLFR